MHSIAFFSLSYFFFLFLSRSSTSVSTILFSITFFFSLLCALCLSLFNILILFSSFLISFGIFLSFPSFFFFGIFSKLSFDMMFRNSTVISIASPFLSVSFHIILPMHSFIRFQSIFSSALKFNDFIVLSLSLVFCLFCPSIILKFVVISILLWSDIVVLFISTFVIMLVSFVNMRSSVLSPRVGSSTTCSIQYSLHIFISFMNCIFSSWLAFDLPLFFQVHPPLVILFHSTKGKLKSPLIIMDGSGFFIFIKIFSISSRITSKSFFLVFGGL